MIEDNIYRTSSQYRFWSFTEESLQAIRAKTNASASERVRAAIRRMRHSGVAPSVGTPVSTPGTPDEGRTKEKEGEVQCLTPEEERDLVRYYCEKTLQLGDLYKPPLPTAVRVCTSRRDFMLITLLVRRLFANGSF